MSDGRAIEKTVDQVEEEYAALVTYELSVAKWEDLEAVEFNDRLLFPDVLHIRQKDGTFKQKKVAFRVPRGKELRVARAMAREIAEREKIDPVADKQLFEDLDDTCIMLGAIRMPTEPHDPLAIDVDDLEKQLVDRDVLKLAWGKLEGFRRVVDPRPAAITREQVLAVVASISRKRDISPLHVFDGPAQTACVVFMASLLQRFLTSEPSKPSSESLTPAP